jgi:glycosyltransferase involved in cell wall biosynthesis
MIDSGHTKSTALNGYGPSISFIVAVFNSAATLEQTLLSITGQTYKRKQIVVIDGGSSDGTVDIIRKYADQIDYWVSEPDRGISDAFNKGVKAATGDYINFQGAGDLLESPSVIEEIFSKIPAGCTDMISCRVKRVEEADTDRVIWVSPQPRSGRFSRSSLLWRMSLYHQGLFVHRSFFEQYGAFDESLRFSMDYEHLLRAYHHFPAVRLVEKVVAKWRADGVGLNRETEVYKEYDFIKRKHRIAPLPVLWLINRYIHAKLFIKKLIR